MIQDTLSLRGTLKRGITGSVRALFHDRARGETPVLRSDKALFAPDSVVWLVHGDVAAMMIGGITALLLQMLHPAVLAGVWDHSNFRADMIGRLRRTARFIAITTYADRRDATAAIERVRKIHERIEGRLPDGTAYRGDDPRLLAWVHVTEAWSFLSAWQHYGDRRLTRTEEDRYFADFAAIGRALGADPVPVTRAGAEDAMRAMRAHLAADHRTREVARLVLGHMPDALVAVPLQRLTMQAAVDLLPDWARRMHGLATTPTLVKPLVDRGALGIARTLRWAFLPEPSLRR